MLITPEAYQLAAIHDIDPAEAQRDFNEIGRLLTEHVKANPDGQLTILAFSTEEETN